MKTIKENVSAQIVEKKSKFIANVYYIDSRQEAEEKIKQIRKKYYDAKHNCFAYRIGDIERTSDDGEPVGTAGVPLLKFLQNQELTNILVIVTRYFGGILLGTGGLVRAYTQVLKQALNNAEIVIEELRNRNTIGNTL